MLLKVLGRLIVSLTLVFGGSIAMAATLTPAADPTHQTSDGLSVYIGVVPAAIVKEHVEGHSEAAMHGGVPTADNEYHLVVAVFDANTGVRVTDASVAATVFGPGNTVVYGQRHLPAWGTRPLNETLPKTPLEAMKGQTITYGDYFVLPKPATYTFQLTVTRPGKTKPTVMNFVYDHRGA